MGLRIPKVGEIVWVRTQLDFQGKGFLWSKPEKKLVTAELGHRHICVDNNEDALLIIHNLSMYDGLHKAWEYPSPGWDCKVFYDIRGKRKRIKG